MSEHTNAPHGAHGGEDPEDGDIVEMVDIEEYAKADKKPPRAKEYRFRIDRDRFTVEDRFVTGARHGLRLMGDTGVEPVTSSVSFNPRGRPT